jgi:hypothetical protein
MLSILAVNEEHCVLKCSHNEDIRPRYMAFFITGQMSPWKIFPGKTRL